MNIIRKLAIATLAFASTIAQAQDQAAPIYGITLPNGYRDWLFISIARVANPVNDMRAKLSNDIAVRAFREGKTEFPDGTIIARLAWNQATSDENNNAVRGILEKQFGSEGTQKL